MKKEYILPITAIVCCAIIGLAYVSVQNIKSTDIKRAELNKKAEEIKREENLEACFLQAELNYNSNWSANCKMEGKKEDCDTLKKYNAEVVEQARKEEKDNCIKLYK